MRWYKLVVCVCILHEPVVSGILPSKETLAFTFTMQWLYSIVYISTLWGNQLFVKQSPVCTTKFLSPLGYLSTPINGLHFPPQWLLTLAIVQSAEVIVYSL